ncbi:RCC1 domain-containing protein [Pendulispora brunnea]|uniref:RCC1 domain-containing protein n=1 Tax=Pendulispora brunnea TaxID=2905690 RepID=UPI00374E0B6D
MLETNSTKPSALRRGTRSVRMLGLALLGASVLTGVTLSCGDSDSTQTPKDAGMDRGMIGPLPDPPEPSIHLSAGGGNLCVTRGDTVRCWGTNDYAQLGQGEEDGTTHPPPGKILPGTWATLPSIYVAHACAITAGNEISCWGKNGDGETGRVPEVDGGDVTRALSVVSNTRGALQVSTGDGFSCAAFDRGTSCWGVSSKGRIGPFNGERTASPNAIPGLDGVASLQSGKNFSCARKHDGSIWCWGAADHAQIGRAKAQEAGADPPPHWDTDSHPQPRQVLAGTLSLAVGKFQHSCAILSDRKVACWGDNLAGQLGHDWALDPPCERTKCNGRPTVVSGLSAAREIAVGYEHSCAVLTDDMVYCWGNNASGALGHDPALDRYGCTPVPTQVLGVSNVAHIVAGFAFTCAITRDDHAWCWGSNIGGVLGPADPTASTFTPVRLEGI